MVCISSFRGDYSFLSNFYPCSIEFEGLTYSNAEAAFHAQKCSDPEGRVKYTRVKNPVIAKRMGRREVLPDDWSSVSPELMRRILLVKFSDPELARLLISTGDAYLEEGNHWHDNHWGNCTCESCKDIEGENLLGQILMGIRSRLIELSHRNNAC